MRAAKARSRRSESVGLAPSGPSSAGASQLRDSSRSASGLPAASRRIPPAGPGPEGGRVPGEQLVGRCVVDPGQLQDVRTGQPAVGVAGAHGRDDQHDPRPTGEAPAHEREHLRGRRVEPLQVVGGEQDRPLAGDGGEQGEDGLGGEEQLGPLALGEAERRPDGVAVAGGQGVLGAQERREELVEPPRTGSRARPAPPRSPARAGRPRLPSRRSRRAAPTSRCPGRRAGAALRPGGTRARPTAGPAPPVAPPARPPSPTSGGR